MDLLAQPKEVQEIILQLAKRVQHILGDQFCGFYIRGSLAVGDFNPQSSDIDFAVITKEKLSRETFDTLAKMHTEFRACDNPWASRLEGSYIPRQMLSQKEPPTEPRPYLNGDRFYLAQYGSEWLLELYTIREHGIVIAGLPPQNLISPILVVELKQASHQLLKQHWAPMLTDSTLLQDSEYQVYAILTMCRTLHICSTGTFASKKVAAEWAQNALPCHWKVLIEQATLWTKGAVFEHISETLALIEYTVGCNSME